MCHRAQKLEKEKRTAETCGVNKGLHISAICPAIESLEGFLVDWWDSFYSMFSSIQAKHAQDPYAEAAQTVDNVVRQIPFVVPSSSSQRAIFVTDFSHQIEQIPNMSQPREARNEAENVEQTMNKEPIVNTLDKTMLPVRDPSKKVHASSPK
ncbi:hypothetical protein KY284_026561 [Solanum tuberosum]|nr:hypothetical protein KY284_026561 [Solanum tuberosum]